MQNFLVVIDDEKNDQPAFDQALAWAKKLQEHNIEPTITVLLPTYNYAAEINKMVRGTVLNNMTHSLIKAREEWLNDIIQISLDRQATLQEPLNITIEKKVLWEKRPFKAVEKQIIKAEKENTPFDIIFKSLVHHPIHQRLLMQIDEWQIVRISHIPVMLVRKANYNDLPNWIVGIDPEHTYHDTLNEKIVNTAHQLQALLGGAIKFVHATPTISAQMAPLLSPYNGGEIILDSNTLIQESKKSADEFMLKHGLNQNQLISRQGEAAHVLHDFAKEFMNSIIVLGSTTHGRLSDRWIGHIAESIIDYSDKNVLVIKSEATKEVTKEAMQ